MPRFVKSMSPLHNVYGLSHNENVLKAENSRSCGTIGTKLCVYEELCVAVELLNRQSLLYINWTDVKSMVWMLLNHL